MVLVVVAAGMARPARTYWYSELNRPTYFGARLTGWPASVLSRNDGSSTRMNCGIMKSVLLLLLLFRLRADAFGGVDVDVDVDVYAGEALSDIDVVFGKFGGGK